MALLGGVVAPVATATGSGWNVDLVGVEEAGYANAVALDGDVLYCNFGPFFVALDVSDGSNPRRLANVVLPNDIGDIVLRGTYAFVAAHDAGLRVLDVSTPSSPVEVASEPAPPAMGLAIAGSYAYVVQFRSGLTIFDISDPMDPFPVGHTATPGWAVDISVQGSHAYVAEWDKGLRIIDVSDPTHPVDVGAYGINIALGVDVSGAYAYVAGGSPNSGLWILDVTNPTTPTLVSYYETGAGFLDEQEVVVVDDLAYMVEASSDLKLFDISDRANPVLVSETDISGANDLAVSGNYVFTGGGDIGIIDATDPASPERACVYHAINSAWGVAAVRDYVFVGEEGSGLTIFDARDRSNKAEFYSSHFNASFADITATDQFIYMANCSGNWEEDGGLAIIDIADPLHPVEVAYYPDDCIRTVSVSNGYAYVSNYAIFKVVDISNPGMPVEVGSYNTGYNVDGSDVEGTFVYLANREGDLKVVDVSQPASPTEVAIFSFAGYASDVAVAGDYAYVAGTKDAAGVSFRVIDISNPYSPVEVGNYATNTNISGVTVSGNFAYLTGTGDARLRILDVSDPTLPIEVGYYVTGGIERRAAVRGNRIYAASSVHHGLFVLETPLVSGVRNEPPLLSITYQSYPNPFNLSATILMTLDVTTTVDLTIFDVQGRKVVTLADGRLRAGPNRFVWNGRDSRGVLVSSGIYFCRLTAEGQLYTQKITLLR